MRYKAFSLLLRPILLEQCKKHQIEFLWVKGHSGNIENERCDELAVQACNSKNLIPDKFYESNPAQEKVIAHDEDIDNAKISSTSSSTSKGTNKITQEGQPCRKCSTPVVKHTRRKDKPVKASKSYYYEYFFVCPHCRTYYYVKDAIKYINQAIEQPKLF